MIRMPGYIPQHLDRTPRPACTCNPAPWHDGDPTMNRHLDQLHTDGCAIITERRTRLAAYAVPGKDY